VVIGARVGSHETNPSLLLLFLLSFPKGICFSRPTKPCPIQATSLSLSLGWDTSNLHRGNCVPERSRRIRGCSCRCLSSGRTSPRKRRRVGGSRGLYRLRIRHRASKKRQGTTSVVPIKSIKCVGFSPCGPAEK